jgi:hypothetical protein
VVRESGNWDDHTECGRHHRSSESHHSYFPMPSPLSARLAHFRLPLLCSRCTSSSPSPTITPNSPALGRRRHRQRMRHYVPWALSRSTGFIYCLRRPLRQRHARRTGRLRCTFILRSLSAACQTNKQERCRPPRRGSLTPNPPHGLHIDRATDTITLGG